MNFPIKKKWLWLIAAISLLIAELGLHLVAYKHPRQEAILVVGSPEGLLFVPQLKHERDFRNGPPLKTLILTEGLERNAQRRLQYLEERYYFSKVIFALRGDFLETQFHRKEEISTWTKVDRFFEPSKLYGVLREPFHGIPSSRKKELESRNYHDFQRFLDDLFEKDFNIGQFFGLGAEIKDVDHIYQGLYGDDRPTNNSEVDLWKGHFIVNIDRLLTLITKFESAYSQGDYKNILRHSLEYLDHYRAYLKQALFSYEMLSQNYGALLSENERALLNEFEQNQSFILGAKVQGQTVQSFARLSEARYTILKIWEAGKDKVIDRKWSELAEIVSGFKGVIYPYSEAYVMALFLSAYKKGFKSLWENKKFYKFLLESSPFSIFAHPDQVNRQSLYTRKGRKIPNRTIRTYWNSLRSLKNSRLDWLCASRWINRFLDKRHRDSRPMYINASALSNELKQVKDCNDLQSAPQRSRALKDEASQNLFLSRNSWNLAPRHTIEDQKEFAQTVLKTLNR